MFFREIRTVALAMTFLAAGTGCGFGSGRALEPASDVDPVGAVKPALAASRFYLRCKATGLEFGDNTRLAQSEVAGVLELSFDVREPWMVSDGDRCVLAETPQQKDSEPKLYVTPHQALLRVPTSSRMALYEGGGNPSFKVQYPEIGTYRALLDTRLMTLSIRSTNGAVPGEISWTAYGDMQLDSDGNVYGISSVMWNNTLSRLDTSTGLRRWVRFGDDAFYPQSDCGTNTELIGVVSGPRAVVSLDPETGMTQWRTDLDGDLGRGYGYVSCDPNADFVLVGWGYSLEHQTAIRKSDGATLWTYAGPSRVRPQYRTGDRVVFQRDSRELGGTILEGVNTLTGETSWSRTFAGSSATVTQAWGELYLRTETGFYRLNPENGAIQWAYNGLPQGSLKFEAGILLLTRWNDQVVRLSRRDGREIWRHDLSVYHGNSSVAVLERGKVYIQTLASSSDRPSATIRLLAASTGSVLWKITRNVSYMTLAQTKEVNDDEVYLMAGNEVTQIDGQTGVPQWTSIVDGVETDALYPGQAASIVDEGADTIYVYYVANGRRYSPSGVVAVSRNDGEPHWDYLSSSPINGRFSDGKHIFVILYPAARVIALSK